MSSRLKFNIPSWYICFKRSMYCRSGASFSNNNVSWLSRNLCISAAPASLKSSTDLTCRSLAPVSKSWLFQKLVKKIAQVVTETCVTPSLHAYTCLCLIRLSPCTVVVILTDLNSHVLRYDLFRDSIWRSCFSPFPFSGRSTIGKCNKIAETGTGNWHSLKTSSSKW